MLWVACICGAICESACRGKAGGRIGATSKSNNPGKEKEEQEGNYS
jgi:hypothetical protein